MSAQGNGPGNGSPVTLINVFEVSLDQISVDEFVTLWKAHAAALTGLPGCRGTRLHQAITPEARFQFINIAYWDSAAEWDAAALNPAGLEVARDEKFKVLRGAANPSLYRVIVDLVDDAATQPGAQETGA